MHLHGNDSRFDQVAYILGAAADEKTAQQERCERVDDHRFILENMADLTGIVNLDGNIRYASPSHKSVLGFDSEWMTGTSAFDYIHPEDTEAVQNQFLDMVHTKSNKQTRFRFTRADGQPVDVDCLGTPVLGADGEVESIIVVSRAIMEIGRMEGELRASEDRYRTLIELSPQPLASHLNEKFIYANPACLRLLGAVEASEIVGKSIFDVIHPDSKELTQNRVKLIAENKFNGSMEFKMIRLDGQIIELEITGIYDDKTESTLIVLNDITHQKKIERDLQESEERYRRLVELSPVGIASYEGGRFTYINPTGMKMMGASKPNEMIGTHPFDWIHPDDRHIVKGRVENTLLEGYSPHGEYRIIRLDGQTVNISAISLYDPESSVTQIVIEDITARKQAEQALLKSEELNRQLVELSPQALAFHHDYKYHYFNSAGLALFGASSLNDILGRSVFDFIHPDFQEMAAERIAGIYGQQRSDPLSEQKMVRLDGTVFDVEVIAIPIQFMGKNAGLTLISDITQRKMAEENRKHSEHMIRVSEDRYFRLQTSLDRFSRELIGVMKASDMERQFIREVQRVIQTEHVSLIEVDPDNRVTIKCGNPVIPLKITDSFIQYEPDIPICEMVETAEGYFLKFGDFRGKSYLLCFSEKPRLLMITSKRVWLTTIARYVSVLYENFQFIEDLTRKIEHISSNQVAPPWLLRVLFNLSENERKRLSQDLHDSALQEQIIWYRKLVQLTTDVSVPDEIREQLDPIAQGLLNVIYQIRLTCNELRPPLLKEDGLVSSLAALFRFTQLRSNYLIQFDSSGFEQKLSDDVLIGIYRIVQELLANATKHSNAERVHIILSSHSDRIHLIYQDDGVGMDVSHIQDSFSSMGVYGIKERARSMAGTIEFHSSPNQGVEVFLSVPAF